MKTDRYTKVVLTFIAVGLFLNIAINLPVQPAFAQTTFPKSLTINHKGLDILREIAFTTPLNRPVEILHTHSGLIYNQ
tara:strand:- start:98 stop:331 length:234 start_codon:yes stop_codon:yes gene_type:complete